MGEVTNCYMQKMSAQISIIIPVYNAEECLCKCLQSIESQTFQNFEVILINDGSTDYSFEVCKDFANKDKRITVVTQTNSGASSARNRGIEIAKGEWLTFIDADDYVENNYLECLCKNIGDTKTLIIQGLKQVNSTGEEIKKIEFEYSTHCGGEVQKVFDDKEIFEYGYTVAKLYNREIIDKHGIRFNEHISYSEDLLFMLEYILRCKNITFINGANYNYVTGTSSLSQRYNNFDSEFLLFTEYTRLNQAIANRFSFAQTYKSQRYGALILMRSIYSLYKTEGHNRKGRTEIIKRIRKENGKFLRKYYTPNIVFLKILKQVLFLNIRLFDLICDKKLKNGK